MATTDYTGRSVDLLIFQGTAPEGEQKLRLGFSEAGEVTTGIQKLLQTFTYFFITERGTVKYHPTHGTDFVTALKQGRIRDEADVQAEFILAAEQIRQLLALAAADQDLPDDETFASAELVSFELNRAKSVLSMKIRITSVAGATREVFLPVPYAIR